MPPTRDGAATALASTGIRGLDDILRGGLPRNRIHLVQGEPGTGKTTVALQFLLAGAAAGETGLYITLSESRDELTAVARSHGWLLDGFGICELTVPEKAVRPEEQYTLFHPSEVELGETTRSMLEEIERVQPARVVFDSLSEMRLLAGDPLRFRRQILGLKQFFLGRQCTVLLLDDRVSEVDSLATGVLVLDQTTPAYGAERRRLRIAKLRGVAYRGGFHDLVIRTGGLQIFPRPAAPAHSDLPASAPVGSGIAALDSLLGGGLERGTSTLVMGPAGAGKSALATQYAVAAAARGERAAIFLFDESLHMFLRRAGGLGMDVRGTMDAGLMTVQQIDPAEMRPGEFASLVRRAVERDGARIVVIDSLNGYMSSMPEEPFLTPHMHELLAFLGQQAVVTIVLAAQHGLVGHMENPVDVSYLADCVMLLRYFEAHGAIRQALSVVKKRSGPHERTIRELMLGPTGLRVGPALSEFEGVLTGVPRFSGSGERFLPRETV